MLKSLSEFQSLTRTELARMVELGPVVITDSEEPRFVAQSIEAFENTVRRLRQFERATWRRQQIRSGQVIPFRSR
jgi:hypothetical protein